MCNLLLNFVGYFAIKLKNQSENIDYTIAVILNCAGHTYNHQNILEWETRCQ